MHNSSFCRMAFTLCICLLFSGCAASLSNANVKGQKAVTENTQALINDYKARLSDLENNIWQH